MTLRLRQLWSETARGKSIGRILTNQALAQWNGEMRGLVLDLACGHNPSYRRFLVDKNNSRKNFIGVDYNAYLSPAVVANLKESLPFGDGVADAVIVSSFLYIVPNPAILLSEVRRVLKPKGMLLLTAPLIYPHVQEPTDYWRFTCDALRLLLEQTGFAGITIIPVGGRWTAAAYLLSPFLRPSWLLAPLVYWICLQLDLWTERFFEIPTCPIGYVARGTA